MDEYSKIIKLEAIHRYLAQNNIPHYTIDNNFKVNVEKTVVLSYIENGQIPIQFGEVLGSFYASKLGLKTLEGVPEKVKKAFVVSENQLTSLTHSPKYCFHFIASKNNLKNVDGMTQQINGDCDLSDNQIISLKNLPAIQGALDITYNPLTQLDTILKVESALFLDVKLLQALNAWPHQIKEEITLFVKDDEIAPIFKQNALIYEKQTDDIYKLKLDNNMLIKIFEKKHLEENMVSVALNNNKKIKI